MKTARYFKEAIFICMIPVIIAVFIFAPNGVVTQQEADDVKVLTAFFAYPGSKMSSDNRIANRIAENTGVKVEIQWLTGNTVVEERIRLMIAGKDYPDFIDGADGISDLIAAGALLPLETLIHKYPNISGYLSDGDWEKLRGEDGHIYIIPQFGMVNGWETDTNHREEAFWIQKEALRWDGYPLIKTIDEYFDLIERYKAAHPKINGMATVGFEILCDDWRGFCLENPPQFLAGYPNDGCAVVDADSLTASLYDFLPEAKYYFKTLHRAYNKGLIEPDTFVTTYEEYLSILSSGRVLGMVDQYWQFERAQQALYGQGMDERTYAPLGLTVDGETKERYRSVEALDISNGIGISVNCKDPDAAMAFMNDLLAPENMILRYWGEEGVDYFVGEDGYYYRNAQQRANAMNQSWVDKNLCSYNYFPHFDGMLADGINTVRPNEQPGEFYASVGVLDREVLDAYEYDTWVDFLNDPMEINEKWFPLYSFTKNLDRRTKEGKIKTRIDRLRKEWLPRLIMSAPGEFDAMWNAYEATFRDQVDVDAYEALLTGEVRRRSEK